MQKSAQCATVRLPGHTVGQRLAPRQPFGGQRRSLRCCSSGRSEQDGFNFLSWGANLMKRLGGSAPRQSTPIRDQIAREQQTPQEAAELQSSAESESQDRFDPLEAANAQPAATAPEEQDPKEQSLEQRRRSYRHLSRTQEITEDWPMEGTPTWNDWLEDFDATLEMEAEYNDLYEAIERATQLEKFDEANVHKLTLAEFVAVDEIAAILEEYRRAVLAEEFEIAAELRDYGGVGLCGWWWPQSSSAGTSNHIIRVYPAYNRYVFVAYDPSELALVHGILPSPTYEQMPQYKGLEYNPSPSKSDFHNHGVPVVELLYRRFDDTEDGAVPQARDLVAQASAIRFVDPANTLAAETSTSDPATDDEMAEDDDGEEQVIKMEGVELSGWAEGDSSMPVMSVRVEDPNGDEDSFLEQLAFSSNSGSEGEQATFSGSQIPDSLPVLRDPELQRLPAAIQKFENDRDRFLIHIFPSEEEEAAAKAALEAQKGDQMGGDLESPQVEIVHLRDDPDKQALLDKLTNKAKDLGVDLKSRVSVEVKIKGNLENSRKLDFRVLADEIVKGSGKVWESGAVADILKKALERVTKQEGPSIYDNGNLRGSISYKRIPINSSPTDPFTGIYVGGFGQHGLEVLQLQRCIGEDGKEYCEGTKLTGDEAVPAGNVSFRAAIGMHQRMSAFGYYPPELNVSARYKGQGRVAEPGHKNASWTDGELLQFGSGVSDYLKGAQLGFLWNFGSQKHLSLLHRLSLDDPLLDNLKPVREDA